MSYKIEITCDSYKIGRDEDTLLCYVLDRSDEKITHKAFGYVAVAIDWAEMNKHRLIK